MRAFPHTTSNRLHALRARQEGAFMIEVIFSTLVVAMVSAAVLTGVTGSVKTATKNRERSVAAQLAEQDQERMRSYKATQLDGYSNTTTKTVRGIPYTVQSSTSWYFDSSGTKSCTSDTNRASYLKLVSTVRPQRAGTGPPVTMTSLLTPPNGTFSQDKGSLAVLVVDRNGNPRPNLTVNVTGGTTSQSDTTNDQGCANFFYLPVGSPAISYTVTVAAPGLVDRSGSPSPSLQTGVVGGEQTLSTVELDVPVAVNVNFDTKVGAGAPIPDRSQYVRLGSSGLAAPGYLSGSLTSYPSTNNTFTFSSLYPFTSGFSAWAGNCTKNDPTQWGDTANSVAVTPGGGPYTVTARMPAVNIQVKRGSTLSGATVYSAATVRVTPTDSGCTASYPTQTSNGTGPTGTSGALPDPGFPYGNYTVCASDGSKKVTASIANGNAAGTDSNTSTTAIDPTVLWINTLGTSGTC